MFTELDSTLKVALCGDMMNRLDDLNRITGGSTVYRTTGYWFDKETGQVYNEDSIMFTWSYDSDNYDDLVKFVELLRFVSLAHAESGEVCIFVQWNNRSAVIGCDDWSEFWARNKAKFFPLYAQLYAHNIEGSGVYSESL